MTIEILSESLSSKDDTERPPFLAENSFVEQESKCKKKKPPVEIVHQFDETGPLQHHETRHHMKERGARYDHNVPLSVISASSAFNHLYEPPFLSSWCKGARTVE